MSITRRDMLRYGGAIGAGLATGAWSWEESRAQNRGAIGLALCIGLNAVDPARYGSAMRLAGCVHDCNDMAGILRARGFRVRQLLDRETAQRREMPGDVGSIANVEKWINRAAKGLKSGDVFVVSYSGHGTRTHKDANGDERTDGRDDAWCLYDNLMVDDSLCELWSKFAEGVRIVAISDSCHSGTFARFGEVADDLLREARDLSSLHDPDRKAEIAPRAVAEMEDSLRRATEVVERRGPADPSAHDYLPIRQLPDEVRERVLSDPEVQQRVEAAGKVSRDVAELRGIRARVLAIGACQEDQYAGDMSTNGVFTARLKKVWAEATSLQSYARFFGAISAQMPLSQKPNLENFPENLPRFDDQRPFSI